MTRYKPKANTYAQTQQCEPKSGAEYSVSNKVTAGLCAGISRTLSQVLRLLFSLESDSLHAMGQGLCHQISWSSTLLQSLPDQMSF